MSSSKESKGRKSRRVAAQQNASGKEGIPAKKEMTVEELKRERQGRWKKEVRGYVLGRMVSLYFDPEMRELLLATYWL